MTDSAALIRLATMFSPAFPVGTFAYSAGLERVATDGAVRDAASLADWLQTSLNYGAARNDAILFAEAFRRSAAGLPIADLHELALAMAGSVGRRRETAEQGAAFVLAVSTRRNPNEGPVAYAVAAGEAAGSTGAPLANALALFLAAWAANQVQVAIRLSVVGQSGGVAVLAALETPLAETVALAESSTLEDLGGYAIIAEIAAMNQETLETRLFRS